MLCPIDEAVAGHQAQEKILWTDELRQQFSTAQKSLASHKSILLPKSLDQLWIVTDGVVVKRGIDATLYVTRNDRLSVAGFFSAKLKKHQVTWLPCKAEALGLTASVKHFSPFITQ